MPRNRKKSRLNLETSTSVVDRIVRLKERTGIKSKTGVIVKATEVYEKIVRAKKRGEKLILRDAQGKEVEIIVI